MSPAPGAARRPPRRGNGPGDGPGKRPGKVPTTRPPAEAHDRLSPEDVNARIAEVCAFYAGAPGRAAGRRSTWPCPFCSKPKLEVLIEGGIGGCWNASCPVPTTTNALGLIAFFENLDRKGEFGALMRRAREILDGPAATDQRRGPLAGGTAGPGPDPATNRTAKPAAGGPPEPRPSHDPDLAHDAYRLVLASCPPGGASEAFWRSRGVGPETARNARLAFATAPRVFRAIERAERRLGRERLLSVPGFFERGGRVRFTLTGEYHLIPYHDPQGRVATIEGRATDAQRERLLAAGIKAKYVSLRDSGNHLYLFPGLPFDGIEAFTEGTVGAIVAAAEGLIVGAIKGIRCHSRTDGTPLPELSGARFGGRLVPYIPDADWPPNPDVIKEAPRAARNLTLPQGGRPAIANLPRGLDLDEWLISLPEERRRAAFRDLLARASPVHP